MSHLTRLFFLGHYGAIRGFIQANIQECHIIQTKLTKPMISRLALALVHLLDSTTGVTSYHETREKVAMTILRISIVQSYYHIVLAKDLPLLNGPLLRPRVQGRHHKREGLHSSSNPNINQGRYDHHQVPHRDRNSRDMLCKNTLSIDLYYPSA